MMGQRWEGGRTDKWLLSITVLGFNTYLPDLGGHKIWETGMFEKMRLNKTIHNYL